MDKYTVRIINETKEEPELVELWELERRHFSRQDFRNIIYTLFYYAAESIDYAALTAQILKEGKEAFTTRCDTASSGSSIWSMISVARPSEKYYPVRMMAVAD